MLGKRTSRESVRLEMDLALRARSETPAEICQGDGGSRGSMG
jgi:hypothetical protein